MQDKENFMVVCDILYWVNIQDIEPFKMINYKNEDEGIPYMNNVVNRTFSTLNLKLMNKYDQSINDAPDH